MSCFFVRPPRHISLINSSNTVSFRSAAAEKAYEPDIFASSRGLVCKIGS